MNDVYVELKEKLISYSDRASAVKEQIEKNLDKSKREMAKIQADLHNIATLSPTEYQKKKDRQDALFSEVELLEQQLDLIEKTPIVTDEEKADFIKSLKAEYHRIAKEGEHKVYESFKDTLDVCAEYLEQIKLLELLEEPFISALCKSKSGLGFPKLLPDLMSDISKIGLTSYNKVDAAYSNHGYFEESTKRIGAERSEVLKSARKVARCSVPYLVLYNNMPGASFVPCRLEEEKQAKKKRKEADQAKKEKQKKMTMEARAKAREKETEMTERAEKVSL